jgi:hypothetical protein
MKKTGLLPLTIALAMGLAHCGGDAGKVSSEPVPSTTGSSDLGFQPLEFPFANPGVIVRMAAWGIPNWSGSEPHNGMDFQVAGHLASARITSPTAGVVRAVTSSENPYSHPPGQLMVNVAIRVNGEWTVDLNLEPSTADPAMKAAQLAAVLVHEGETVSVGTPLADLLVGPLGYPHLHYMVERGRGNVCAYAHSSQAAKRTIEAIARLPNSTVPGGQICVGPTS